MTALAWASLPVTGSKGWASFRDAAVELVSERQRLARRRSLDVIALRPGSVPPVPVWVLKPQRAGDATQVMALVEGLGLPFEVKKLARRRGDVLLAPPFAASWWANAHASPSGAAGHR